MVRREESEALEKKKKEDWLPGRGSSKFQLPFSSMYMSKWVYLPRNTTCSGNLPHPILRVARGAGCLTDPALDCSLKVNAVRPTEVVSSGKL